MTLADYLVARLMTALDPIPVDDGKPKAATRHIAFYAGDGLYAAGDVAHTSNLVTYRFQLTYIAEGTDADRVVISWMRRKARAVLLDHVPVVDGFAWGPIEPESEFQAQADDDSVDSAISAVDTFVVRGSTA